MGFIAEYYAARTAQATRQLKRQEARASAQRAADLAYANDLAERQLDELVAARTGLPIEEARALRPARVEPIGDVVRGALIALLFVGFAVYIVVRLVS